MDFGGEEYQTLENGASQSELFYLGGNTIINNSLTFSETTIPVISEFDTKEISFFNDKKNLLL